MDPSKNPMCFGKLMRRVGPERVLWLAVNDRHQRRAEKANLPRQNELDFSARACLKLAPPMLTPRSRRFLEAPLATVAPPTLEGRVSTKREKSPISFVSGCSRLFVLSRHVIRYHEHHVHHHDHHDHDGYSSPLSKMVKNFSSAHV